MSLLASEILEKDKEKRNEKPSGEKKVIVKRTNGELSWYGRKILTLANDS